MTKLTDYIEQQENNSKPLNKYVVKLLWRVLSKIDPEKGELTFSDKEALEDAQTCDRIALFKRRAECLALRAEFFLTCSDNFSHKGQIGLYPSNIVL